MDGTMFGYPTLQKEMSGGYSRSKDIIDSSEPFEPSFSTRRPIIPPLENVYHVSHKKGQSIKFIRVVEAVSREYERMQMNIEEGPNALAERSDDMQLNGLHQNQVSRALNQIIKRIDGVDKDFIETFKLRRKLIADTKAEMHYYEDHMGNKDPTYAIQMEDIAHEFTKKLNGRVKEIPIAEVERLSRYSVSCGYHYNKQTWDRGIVRLILILRGVKDAAYFKRLRMDYENRFRQKRKPRSRSKKA